MDALLWSTIAIAVLGGLGMAGRWADRHIARNGRHRKLAELVLKVALGTYYLAFAFGVSALLYVLVTGKALPACLGVDCS